MRVVIIKGINIKKMFSRISSHHKCRETDKIIKGVKSCFSPLPRNQSTPERNPTMKKGKHYLSIICENHRFQDPIGFL